jgi:hypothetical protein
MSWRYVGSFGRYQYHPHAVERFGRTWQEILNGKLPSLIHTMMQIEPYGDLEDLIDRYSPSLTDTIKSAIKFLVQMNMPYELA